MTGEEFRQIALSLPEVVEGSHAGHTDFRIDGKIFATLGHPDENWAMVKLSPEQQEILVAGEPDIFTPANGAWGKHGSTLARLERLDELTATSAVTMAWRNVMAP